MKTNLKPSQRAALWLLCLLCLLPRLLSAQGLVVDQPSITFGGGIVTSGSHEISSTLGQPIVGTASGGDREFYSGRWEILRAYAFTDVALSSGSIAENQPASMVVGALSAPDPEDGSAPTFSLVSGAGDTDNASFAISGANLVTAAVFNYESKSSYSIRLRATDSFGEYYEKAVTVTVLNVNEAPSNISLSGTGNVNENLAVGSTVGTLSAADQDAGETAAFTLVTGTGDTDNGYFDISGTTLKTKQSINYETKSSLSCRVRVTDGGGLFYEKTFTITINNVNEAPTDISLSAASVLENQPSGTTVGTLTATDPDAGDTVTFSLVSGYGDNASFTIAGGALKTAAAFNYESKSSYSIKVRATDNASLTFDKTFTIAVVNVNEAPTLNALTSVTLLEDAAAQTVSLGGISTGGDSGQTLTITASSSNPALIPNPAVTYSSGSTTGTLAYTPAASLQGTATITVTATDNGGTANGGVNSVSQTFTVTVIQVNDAPTLDALTSVTVDESAGAQTVSLSGIGTGAPNETQTLTFTATSSNTGLIPNPTITYAPPSATGTLTYTPAVLGANGSALITVTLTDNGSTANGGVTTTTRSFTVNVTGVNDAPTIAAISDPAAILEDAGLQTISLGGITAGGGESQSLTVTATSSNTGRVPHPTVTYTSSDTTGTLTYTPVANANGTPTITVTVTDSGNTANGGVKTTITTFKVNITAVNDAPTLDALTSVTINEDAGVQNVSLAGIGSGAANESQSLTVTATSSHTGKIPHPTVTYTSPVASGTLAFTPAANVSGTVTITVRVTDNGGTASGGVNTFTRTFTVSITPVADAPTDIFLSAASVNENLASGSTVGTLTDADADAGDTATFALVSGNGSTDNASFTIDGNALKTAAVFNYEAKSSYAIRLRVTDSTSLTFEKEFNISVNDVNEAPTDIAMASAGVNESAAVGSLAGTLGATDVDADDTATFALVSGTGDTGNANFEVSGTNLLTTAVLDYDTATSHSIRVRVTDGGGLTFDKVLAVAVTNVNAAPTDISLSANSVDERLASGTTVGTLTASDTDAGDTATFTLVSGTGSTDNGSFTITGTSLKTAAVFNYDTKSSYSIRVRVTDSGAGTFEEVFTITVNNVNAAPTDISLSGTSVSENQPAGTFVGSFSASDADAGDTATFTLVSGTGDTDNANFTMAGGALETAAELDFETQTSHSIRVRVTDAGGLFYEEQFTINVGNLADVHNLAGTALWTNRYDNATNDQATAVAVDSSGNVFVAGYSQTGAANTKDFATIAYSTDGLALWTNRHNGPGNNVDQPTAIAVGGNGNVYVAGFSRSGSGAASEDFATVAYSGSGVLLWSNRHNGTGNNSDQPAAIAVNSSGNVFVTGYAHNGTDNDFATVAYSSAGALLWSNVFNGAANGADQATGIAVDASGNVYVTGFSSNGANNDYATVAYSSAGVALWTNVFNGTGNAADQASGIAVDASGNVYVSGFSSNGANNDYATVAYSSAGVALWTNRFNPNGNSDVAYGIAAGGGNVYVTGESAGGGTGGDYYTVAYSSAGGLLWSNRYNGPGNSTDSARAIKTDGAGNVYVTGFSRSSTTAASEDYATVAYSSAGMPLWTNRFNGTGNLTDQALALAVDTNANVYVTGYTGSGTNDDFATIKYAGNLAPTDIVLSASSVAENSASGTVVGTFSLTDPDTGETATYSLVSGTGGTDNSSFTISGNALKTAAVFDYDVKSSYSIRVRATDSGRLTFDKVFTITVGNVNFSPTDISLSAGSVVEHAASGTSVGVLSATDADAGDTHTFTLVSGAGDTDNASFSIAGSALQTAAVFDYEVKNSYSVRVRVTDAGGLTFEEVFAIAVTDANEAPTDILATGFTADWVSMGVSVPGLLGSGSSQGRAVVVSGTDTYVGGTFSVVGTVSANNIAKWNGTTWSVLGAGLNGTVNALALDAGGNLYAGGSFTNVGGSGASYIAKWNGVSWTSLGTGMNGAVNALAFDASGNLYAGGSFTLAGGVSANRVAKWDGSAWSSLGSGVGSAVNALAVDASGNLYVGGNFTTAGGATANRIAKWDGAAWSALGTGMSGGTPTAVVNALAFDGSGNLYAGGEFTSAGGTSASRVAKWNGSAWAALGTGIANTVDALAVNGSDLYAGGNFSTAGGGSASRIAKWDGSAWAALGSGLGNTAFALAVDGGDLYAGGSFTTAGGNPAVGIAKWNGSAWSAFGTWAGVNGLIQAAVYVGTNLYVGGDFTTAGGVTVNRIAKWDGSAWSALGSGVPNNSVLCLAAIGTDLYVGGSFTSAGGVANTTRIAKWNGTAWSAMGTGGNNAVAALAVIGADLYAGGAFTSMGGVANTARIAKWNGTSWSALGTGADNTVRALAVSGTDLYVGGSIDFAGGISAKSVAKWSTASSTWSALGSGLNSAVRALAIDSGGNLCVGGDFTTAGGISANRVAKWNGSAWSTLGTGMNNNVYAMVADGAGNIYAGGGFSTADGGSASRVAKWNGSAWSAVGSGMDGSANQSVLALAFAGSDLYAGGGFTTASGKVSPYLARAQIGVGENAALGTTVATLTTVDVDSGGSHTYTLVTGTGDADNGSFMIVGDALKTATALDYETKSSYTVRVRVTDGGGLTVEKAFGISVTNVNDTPTDITLSAASVAENQPAGTTVGTLATSDQDAGDTVVFTLVSGTGSTDNASFTLAGTTLQTSASFDYESKSSYSIRVRATDSGGLTYEEAFTVTVINVNDAPTDISLSTASVAENAASGATVGTLTATDADAGDTATLTFVVGVGSEDNDSFTISGGALQTATVFNYEVKSSYSVRVQVTDAGGLTFEKAFTIAINDANDAPVDIALSAVVVTENAAIGTGIGSFTATDVDAGDSHTFTLVSGAGSADNASFTLAGNTLQTAARFDYETKGSHSIRVRATDGGGLFVEKQFTVTVTDANDAPSNISLSASSVAENAVSGTAVGTLTAADQDAGDTAAFTLVSGAGDSDNASFTLAGNTLQTAASFDYETKRSLSLRVRATDAGGLPFEQQLTVTVTEVYEYTAGWTNRYDGPASGFDQASAVAVDAAGNVFVAGYSHNGTDNDYVTIKYLADGSAAWTNRYDGPGNNTGEAKALVVDSDGSVYVTGFSQGASTRDYATIKYLADGTPAWTNRYDGPGGTADEAAAISVDGSGNVFVTGFAGNDYATVGYSSAGTALWTNRYNGPANGNDQARAVAVDGTGSVFVTGFSVGSGSSQDYATIKYLANGTPAWTNRYTGATGSSADFAKALAVDSAGNVFVTGYSGANNDYATVAYSGAGTPLWTNRYNGTGNGNDQAAAVAVDAGGNVMVTGKSLGAGTGFDYATIKYSGAGVALWTNRYNNGAISDDDSAQALGVDASGQVLVAGFSRMAVGQDFVTLKYSSAGVPLWTNNYNGPGNANDYAYALAVDHAGNVFVAGGSDGDGTSHDFAVVKYAARTAPASILLSAASLAENSDAGTTVGTLTAQDFDAGDTAVFTLVSGAGDTDNASFVIAGVELQTAASFDYETKSSYSLRVRATDGLGLTYEQVFTVNVLNVNEAPAGIDLDNIFIAENEPSGTVVGALASSDADAGDTVTYTLVSGEGDADNGSFTIVNGTNLATTAAFDYETQDVFTLRVRATDGGGLFTEVQFFILVEDLIEAPTNILLSNASVAENQAAGALVGILSAVDQDIGDTAAFALVSGTGGDDNGSFSIVGGTNLVTAATFDYEAKNSYSVRVRVTDSGDLAFEKAFTIAISDVNDAPTDISLSASSVTENAAIGTTVGTFAAADVDAGDTATFTFVSGGGGDDNAAFSIAGAALQTAAAFDYEVKNSYSVRVRVTDGGGLSFEKQFTITVTNANEAPTDISLSAGSVAENSASGTTVGTLSGTDVDAGDTAAFTLVSGAGDTDNAAFSIVGTALKTAAVFNYEAKSSYTVRVRVADGGGLSFEKQFTVSVTDVNDAPTNLTLGHASVAENEPAGALVGALAASDADSGASATFTLVPGAGSQDNESFSVVNGTNLVTADTFDFEFRDSYSLRVRATDNGGLYFERVLTIAVTDVNETPLDIELTSTSVAENAAPGTVVGVLASVEYDFVDTAVFALVSGDGDADNALFSISDGTNLVTAAVFDFEATNSYSLRVRVTDSATNVFERQFTVTVLDVNEFTLTNQTVALIEDTGAQQIILGSSVASGATYLVLGGPAHGTVSVFGNIATYTAFNNFQGLDTFTYILSNALGTSTVATVTVNVANVLDILPYAFSNAVDYAVGLAPAAIVAGKFYKGNDLAVANYSNNTVSILLNSGKGYFTNAVPPTVAVGNGPVALATANFNSHTNKDTKPDLVVAHQLDETLQVLLGDGLGGFTNLAPLALDHRPSALAAGDLNKDTRADVVLANGDDETITVLLGLGDGTFGDDTHYIVGTNPVAVVVADFNKDMKADVATANYGENTVSILWGVGTGALSNAVHYAVGANPNALAVGDFNKDGRSDLVVANYGDDTISVLLSVRQTNSGVRTNTFTRTDYPVGINPSAVIVTNINKDAYQDIIVAGYYENTVQVLLGRTNGVFEPYYNDPSATEPVGTNPIALAVGNFNADTDLDVAVANWGSGNVSILLNNYTPVAYAQKLNVVEDTATPITLTATFGPLNYLILSGPTNGSFILTNGAMSNATANPVLTYLPATNANGKDLITFKVQDDGGKTSKVVKLEIVILPVNDAPSFSLASNAIELAEDSLKRSITNFAINLDRGADGHATEAKQMLFFVVTNSASNLFKAQPAMTLAGTNTLLTFEPAKNAHGEATVGVFLKDKSGTASGGVDTSAQAFFTLTITNVNDTPVLFNWPAAFPTVKTNSSTNITFAVWDADTGTNGLFYSVNWTNTVLFPDAALKGDLAAFASTNFAFGTVGTNRTLTIYPAFGQKGTDKLIVTIYDGTNSVSKTNAVTVK